MSVRLFIIAFFLWPLAACFETQENIYASFSDAQIDGAISRGWIPAWLPTTATAIAEAHNLDTNHFMVRFSFPVQAQVSLPNNCSQISPFAPPSAPFSRKWWPSDVPASRLSTYRHTFYQCGSAFVAIASNLGEGFSWQP